MYSITFYLITLENEMSHDNQQPNNNSNNGNNHKNDIAKLTTENAQLKAELEAFKAKEEQSTADAAEEKDAIALTVAEAVKMQVAINKGIKEAEAAEKAKNSWFGWVKANPIKATAIGVASVAGGVWVAPFVASALGIGATGATVAGVGAGTAGAVTTTNLLN